MTEPEESRGLLLPLAVAGVFVAAFVYALHQAGARARSLKSLAASRGWTYSRTDAIALTGRVEDLFPGQRFRLESVMTAEAPGGRSFLFECGYHGIGWTDVSFAAGALRPTPAVGAEDALVEIFPRVALEEKLEADKVPIADEEFSKRFIVASKDAARARRVANPRLRAALLARARSGSWTPQRINVARGRIAVLAGPNQGEEVFPELLALLDALEGALK